MAKSERGRANSSNRSKSTNRSKSSNAWLREHHDDLYVQKARAENYRSRAVYKLIEIDKKDNLLKPGMTVVDLGAAPGSWTQYCAERVGVRGRVIASDILPISAPNSLGNVNFIEGDFTEQSVLDKIAATLGECRADLVLSDMAPNLTGVAVSDQARAIALVELAHDLAQRFAKPGSHFVAKIFQGEGFDEVIKKLRSDYTKVLIRKPDASRDRSREVFAVARNLLLV